MQRDPVLPAGSPAELAQPRVADPEVMTHLVSDRPPIMLGDLGFAVTYARGEVSVDGTLVP